MQSSFPRFKARILRKKIIQFIFPSSKPSNLLLNNCTKVLLLTPDGPWNPKSDDSSRNENNMSDCKGEMIEKKDRARMLMSEIEDDKMMEVSEVIS